MEIYQYTNNRHTVLATKITVSDTDIFVVFSMDTTLNV